MARALSVLRLGGAVGALLQRAPAGKYAYGLEAVRPLRIYELTRRQKVPVGVFVYGAVPAASLPTLTASVSSFPESQGPMLTIIAIDLLFKVLGQDEDFLV